MSNCLYARWRFPFHKNFTTIFTKIFTTWQAVFPIFTTILTKCFTTCQVAFSHFHNKPIQPQPILTRLSFLPFQHDWYDHKELQLPTHLCRDRWAKSIITLFSLEKFLENGSGSSYKTVIRLYFISSCKPIFANGSWIETLRCVLPKLITH